jgi:hypothetical protein
MAGPQQALRFLALLGLLVWGSCNGVVDGDGGDDGDDGGQDSPAVSGSARFTTSAASLATHSPLSDQLIIVVRNLPPPADGAAWYGWLQGSDTDPLSLGPALHDGTTLELRYLAAVDLLATFDTVLLTEEASDDPPAPGTPALTATLPAALRDPLRHLLSLAPADALTPQRTPFAGGLVTQLASVWLRAEEGRALADLAAVRAHAEQVVNGLEGVDGPNWGDLDGSGNAEDYGDGYGVLPFGEPAQGYLADTEQRLALAIAAVGADDAAAVRGEEAGLCLANAGEAALAARDDALAAAGSTDLATATTALGDAAEGLALALFGDGGSPQAPNLVAGPDQGGAWCAWSSIQRMATLLPGEADETR